MIISVARLWCIIILVIVVIFLLFTAPQNMRVRTPNQAFEWAKDF